jgi:hypothetical protein
VRQPWGLAERAKARELEQSTLTSALLAPGSPEGRANVKPGPGPRPPPRLLLANLGDVCHRRGVEIGTEIALRERLLLAETPTAASPERRLDRRRCVARRKTKAAMAFGVAAPGVMRLPGPRHVAGPLWCEASTTSTVTLRSSASALGHDGSRRARRQPRCASRGPGQPSGRCWSTPTAVTAPSSPLRGKMGSTSAGASRPRACSFGETSYRRARPASFIRQLRRARRPPRDARFWRGAGKWSL